MAIITDAERVDEVLARGVDEVVDIDRLRERMLRGEQLRVKLGIDPTSPNLHIGRSIPLLKLRDFQQLGHQVVLIVGDFTGVIGDTSDKESERPMLDAERIAENMATYREQIGTLIDLDAAEFRYNSEWLAGLTYKEIGEHTDLFSVADFISRDNIHRRLESGTRVSLREVLYPLMQGYDSVAVRADVELGGTDQWFNLLAGRTLQEHFGQDPQAIITGPLINGTDGRKMSSSWGNTINLSADPVDMYGKVMRMHDGELITYFTICTRVPQEEVSEIQTALYGGANPRDAKMRLARAIVTLYYDATTAEEAEKVFVETFQKGNVPDEIGSISAPYDEALIAEGIVSSKSELRRLLDGGAVRNLQTDEKLEALPTSVDEPTDIKIGKRRFVRLT